MIAHSATQTALLIALLMKRSKSHRGQISDATLRFLSKRILVSLTFVKALTVALDDLGIALIQTAGGFALIYVKSLNGAPSLTPQLFLKENPPPMLTNSQFDFGKILEDLEDIDPAAGKLNAHLVE